MKTNQSSHSEIEILHYQAKLGLGITFPAKTFIIEEKTQILVISPCDLPSEMMGRLRSSSKKIIFLAPNNFHHLHLSKMKTQFPQSEFYGPTRAQKQAGFSLKPPKELTLEDSLLVPIRGNKALGEVCIFHKPSRTLLVTDLFFNMHHPMNLPMKIVMKLAGSYHRLATSRLVKSTINDHSEFTRSIKDLTQLEIEKVIPAHGDPIAKNEFLTWVESWKEE